MRLIFLHVLSTFVLFSFGFSSYAQSLNAEDVNKMLHKKSMDEQLLLSISSPIKFDKKSNNRTYLYLNWISATVFTQKGQSIGCQARYNVLGKWMEINVNNTNRKLHHREIKGVMLNQDLFIPLASKDKDALLDIEFFEVVAGGKTSLLHQYKIEIVSSIGGGLYPTMGQEKEFKMSKSLFYCVDKGHATRLKKGKKNVLKAFDASKQQEISEYADQQGISFRKVDDLKDLFTAYNKAKVTSGE